MSTYTDLHNRVKENITVDYHSRITPQIVRLYNEKNEFWGTLKGHISAENISINGGVIAGVTLKDTTLTGSVMLPGNYDLAQFGNNIRQISVDLDATSARLYKEEDTRLTADNELSYKIETVKSDILNKISSTDSVVESLKEAVAKEMKELSDQLSIELTR